LSEPIRIWSVPMLTIGSIARVMPSTSSGPVPGSPWLGICGSSCISRPIPWPTRLLITCRPSDSTRRWIAAETSPRWLPAFASAMPTKSESRVTSSRCWAGSEIWPIGIVRAASATQPSLTTPMSIESTSPRLSSYEPGIPCTTIEFGEAQIEPGKPR
jgi:hypothetical protein